MRYVKSLIRNLLFCIIFALFFCEYLVYHIIVSRCSWPTIRAKEAFTYGKFVDESKTARVIILSDPHLLGSQRGHWFDKLRREWQMKRSFQTAMVYLKPEVVIILGDIFDEGMICSDEEWVHYVARFWDIFAHPKEVNFYVTPGNHDIGFHERLMYKSRLNERFKKDFDVSGVSFVNFKENIFVFVNSMAFEQDGCLLCVTAEQELSNVGDQLACSHPDNPDKLEQCKNIPKSSQPILFQHFPLYRSSEINCTGVDAPPVEMRGERNRAGWEVLAQSASDLLLKTIQPRLIFSGHTHHSCHIVHNNNIHEYSLPSFSWRNRNDPSFLMASFNPNGYSLQKCSLPEENMVIMAYIFFGILTIIYLALWMFGGKLYNLSKLRIFHKKRAMKKL